MLLRWTPYLNGLDAAQAATESAARYAAANKKSTQIYICFEAHDEERERSSYVIFSLELKSLLSQHDEPPKTKRLDTLEGDDVCAGMGCGQLGPTMIMLVGGIKPAKEEIAATETHADRLSNMVFEFDTYEDPHPSFKHTTPMLSGKAKPLVVELDHHLFVLDGSHIAGASTTPFEAYNPARRQWYEMTLPLFFNPFYAAHKSFPYFSYVVALDKIWASSPTTPVFKYNPYSTFWNIANIFEMGSFPFMGKAAALIFHGYDDVVLISFEDGVVSAHVVENSNGNASTFKLKQVTPPEYFLGCFADLGDHRLCLVSAPELKNALNSDIHVVTFKVCRTSSEIYMEILSSYKYDAYQLSTGPILIWRTAGCFAM